MHSPDSRLNMGTSQKVQPHPTVGKMSLAKTPQRIAGTTATRNIHATNDILDTVFDHCIACRRISCRRTGSEYASVLPDLLPALSRRAEVEREVLT